MLDHESTSMYEKGTFIEGKVVLSDRRIARIFATQVVLIASALGGCAIIDDHVRNLHVPSLPDLFHNDPSVNQPVVDQPSKSDVPTGQNKTDQLTSPASAWWETFHNDELNRLIDSAMKNNHDLKVAVSRIAQAEEGARIADADLYPTETMVPSQTSAQSAAATSTTGYYRLSTLSFKTSYEVDLWGKNGFAAESALALAQASVHYREGVALTLASDISKSYVDYLSETDHIAVAEDNLSNARNSLQAVKTRMEQGDATQVELLQQETTVSNAEGVLFIHRLSREKAFNKLAALLGMTPSEIDIKGGTLNDLRPPDLGPGIPSKLLCRRPDVRRAEATMIGAELDIKVARAKMLPDFTFSYDRGWSSYYMNNLVSNQFKYSDMLFTLTQPLYDAGKNAAAVRQNRAKYVEMIETYHQVIIGAVHDVEDALATLRLTGEQRKALVRAADFAQQAYDISTYSFDKHAIDFLSLLESQRALYSTKDAEVSARSDLFKSSIDLFTALGGGLEEPHC